MSKEEYLRLIHQFNELDKGNLEVSQEVLTSIIQVNIGLITKVAEEKIQFPA